MINILLAENTGIDSRIRRADSEATYISELTEELDISEQLVKSAFPFGLAYLICLGEDEESASRFERLYKTARDTALRSGRAKTEGIAEVYG